MLKEVRCCGLTSIGPPREANALMAGMADATIGARSAKKNDRRTAEDRNPRNHHQSSPFAVGVKFSR